MPAYLVEMFLARADAAARAGHERRVRSAAAQLTRAGTHVHFEGAIHVPGDEMCFFIFHALSVPDVELAARHAGLDPVRIIEAIPFGEERATDEADVD